MVQSHPTKVRLMHIGKKPGGRSVGRDVKKIGAPTNKPVNTKQGSMDKMRLWQIILGAVLGTSGVLCLWRWYTWHRNRNNPPEWVTDYFSPHGRIVFFEQLPLVYSFIFLSGALTAFASRNWLWLVWAGLSLTLLSWGAWRLRGCRSSDSATNRDPEESKDHGAGS